jgi:hypothetical protein
MSTIEDDWAEFFANTGLGIEGRDAELNARAAFFAAFSRGWMAAIKHLQERQDSMAAEMQTLQVMMGRPQ